VQTSLTLETAWGLATGGIGRLVPPSEHPFAFPHGALGRNMDNLENSKLLLKASGFVELRGRGLWFHRDRRLAFSEKVLQDHDLHWVESRLLEEVPKGEFHIHSNQAVPPDECHRVVDKLGLGLSHLIPVNRHWI
jgi:hypothetical protein